MPQSWTQLIHHVSTKNNKAEDHQFKVNNWLFIHVRAIYLFCDDSDLNYSRDTTKHQTSRTRVQRYAMLHYNYAFLFENTLIIYRLFHGHFQCMNHREICFLWDWETYSTEVSSIFSSSASRYVIKYSHIAFITRSVSGSSAVHSGRRGWSTESTTSFSVSNIFDALTSFSTEILGRDSRICTALSPRGPGISTYKISLHFNYSQSGLFNKGNFMLGKSIPEDITSRDCKEGKFLSNCNKSPTAVSSNGFPRRFKYERHGSSRGVNA